MQWSSKFLEPTERTLREFGGLSVLFLGYASYTQEFVKHNHNLAIGFASLAVCMGIAALAKPSLIKPIYVGAMVVTFPIGWTVSRLILGFLYYFLITPIALVFRLIGRDVLTLKYNPAATSYWSTKNISSDPNRYFSMY